MSIARFASRNFIVYYDIMDEERRQKISEIITDGVKVRGWDIDKLSQITGISERYLANLAAGDFKKLPALPYIRGYLTRIAGAFDLDKDFLWQSFLEESGAAREIRSGLNDKMPKNRFRKKTFWYKAIIFFVIAVLAGSFLFYRFFMVDNPDFSFVSPIKDGTRFGAETITIQGKVDPRYKLVFGGEQVLLDEAGRFEKEVILDPGLNVLVFKAGRILGREHEFTRQVFYEKPRDKETLVSPTSTSIQPPPQLPTTQE